MGSTAQCSMHYFGASPTETQWWFPCWDQHSDPADIPIWSLWHYRLCSPVQKLSLTAEVPHQAQWQPSLSHAPPCGYHPIAGPAASLVPSSPLQMQATAGACNTWTLQHNSAASQTLKEICRSNKTSKLFRPPAGFLITPYHSLVRVLKGACSLSSCTGLSHQLTPPSGSLLFA